MAKKAAAPATYEPDAIYIVELKRAVPYGGMVLRPCDAVQLKGKNIAALGDAVLSATKK